MRIYLLRHKGKKSISVCTSHKYAPMPASLIRMVAGLFAVQIYYEQRLNCVDAISYHLYEVQHDDWQGDTVQIIRSIIVNHRRSLVTRDEIKWFLLKNMRSYG